MLRQQCILTALAIRLITLSGTNIYTVVSDIFSCFFQVDRYSSSSGYINGQLTDTMVQCRLFSLHSAFSIVSENAIKSTEVSLLYKYAILRSHEIGGLGT